MSKYEINIGTSILSIPNIRTSQTTLNSLFAINPSTAGVSYPLQVINQDVTSGNIAIIGVGHAPLNNGNGNSTLVHHAYFGSNNTANSSYFGLSGTGKPALVFTNSSLASLNNCTLDLTQTTLDRRISLYGSPAAGTFQYEGLGIDSSAIVYNTGSTTNSHVFYAATSAVARTELFRVAGTGAVSIPATGAFTSDGLVSANAGLNASNNSAGVPPLNLTNNGITTGLVRLLDCFAPNISTLTGYGLARFGASTTRFAYLRYYPRSTSTASFMILGANHEGAAIGGQIRIYADDVTPSEFPNSGGLTVQGPVTANAGLSTTTITASGLVSANAGLSSTTITASGLVSANAGFSATSTTTNGINLSSNITEGIRITSSAASVNAVTLGCYATGVPDSTPIQFGFANTTGDQAKLNFSYSSANSPFNFMTLQMGAAIFKMSNSTTNASTLNTPLTVTGLVTGTNLSATSFTASRVASIDGSKNLISTDQALLKLAASNTDYSLLGSSSPDGSTNTRIVVSGNSRGITPGDITYVATGINGGHVWWTGGTTQKMILETNGSLTVADTVKAKPRYASANLTVDQLVPAFTVALVNSWVQQSSYLGLTTDGTRYTNTYGYTVFVLVSINIVWDVLSLNTNLRACVLKNGSLAFGKSNVEPNGAFAVHVNSTCIVPLASGEYFEIEVTNSGATNLDLKGATYNSNLQYTQFDYYILN